MRAAGDGPVNIRRVVSPPLLRLFGTACLSVYPWWCGSLRKERWGGYVARKNRARHACSIPSHSPGSERWGGKMLAASYTRSLTRYLQMVSDAGNVRDGRKNGVEQDAAPSRGISNQGQPTRRRGG